MEEVHLAEVRIIGSLALGSRSGDGRCVPCMHPALGEMAERKPLKKAAYSS